MRERWGSFFGRQNPFCATQRVFFKQPQTPSGKCCVGKMPRAKTGPKARGEREEKGTLGSISISRLSRRNLIIFSVVFVVTAILARPGVDVHIPTGGRPGERRMKLEKRQAKKCVVVPRKKGTSSSFQLAFRILSPLS